LTVWGFSKGHLDRPGRFSARVIPRAGSAINAEPPPEIKRDDEIVAAEIAHGLQDSACRRLARRTGWAASMILMRPAGTAWPYRMTTTPETSTSAHAASSAAAIAAEALPAPTTTQRPLGFGGKCRSRAAAG